MSGITSLLYSALRSMETATQSLAVASNNIANEKTPGYAKQRLLVEPSPNQADRLLTGTGVEAVKIEAVRDQLLESRLRQQVSNRAGDDLLHNTLRDIEALFNDAADTGMLPPLTNFFNSFHSLALDPSSLNFRELVRTAADDLTRSFTVRGEELRRIQTLADQSIADDINTINSLAEQIAVLSREIQTQEAGGQGAHDLRDKRGQLVKELSEFTDITEIKSSTDYLLSMGNVLLVYGGRTSPVTADTSGASGLVAVKVGSVDVTSTITAGRIHAQLQIRDKFVPDYLGKLDQLAYEITQQVNAIHSVAYDRSGNTGVTFFDPLASATDAARQIKVNSAITADLTKIAAAKQAAGTDNEAATDIGNLIHTKVFTGGSVVDQYRSLVFTLGSDTTNAQGKLEQDSALLHQLENRRDSISGVSIDEETMKILQFQRAYQASASVIRIVDELLQTVLQIGR
jgi:flagellar hook-associated protein 1 FlgK